jgi:hypothetical protein
MRLRLVRGALGVYAGLPRSVGLMAAAAPGRAATLVVLYALCRLLEPAGVWFSRLAVDALAANRPAAALIVVGG